MKKVFFALAAAAAAAAGACATGSIDGGPDAGSDASSSNDATTTDAKAGDGGTNDATTCTAPSLKCATDAGSVCADIKTDINHCGQCTNACATADAGALVPGTNNPDSGVAFDGGAGWSLGSPTCDGGSCGTACGSMTECSDGICYDTQNFHGHCGDCNTACAADTEWCNGGHCCKLNEMTCAGACTDVLADKNNCGGCGVVCSGTKPFCSQGVCTAACSPQGTRQAFNTLNSHTSSGCWNGNPCAQGTYVWQMQNGQSFINANEDVICGGTTACVDHIGITTYEQAGNCQGSWDVYCDTTKVGTIDTTNKACQGDSMTNGCSITLTTPATCTTIRFVGLTGSVGACCGSTGLHSMLTAVSAW